MFKCGISEIVARGRRGLTRWLVWLMAMQVAAAVPFGVHATYMQCDAAGVTVVGSSYDERILFPCLP